MKILDKETIVMESNSVYKGVKCRNTWLPKPRKIVVRKIVIYLEAKGKCILPDNLGSYEHDLGVPLEHLHMM